MDDSPARSRDGSSGALLFRPTVPLADRAGWLALRCALWPECSADEHLAEMEEIVAEPERSTAFVAETPDGRLVGLAEAAIRPWSEGALDVPVVHLEGWIVATEWRRRGIGRALVECVEAWGRERGAQEFTSDTEVDNTASQAAHRALGFDETCRVVNYRRAFRRPEDPTSDQAGDQAGDQASDQS